MVLKAFERWNWWIIQWDGKLRKLFSANQNASKCWIDNWLRRFRTIPEAWQFDTNCTKQICSLSCNQVHIPRKNWTRLMLIKCFVLFRSFLDYIWNTVCNRIPEGIFLYQLSRWQNTAFWLTVIENTPTGMAFSVGLTSKGTPPHTHTNNTQTHSNMWPKYTAV